MGNTNLDAIEREVQRRLTDKLVAAGVDQGRISLECLYMLPPEFVRAYTKLFNQALREDMVSAGSRSDGKKGIKREHRGELPMISQGSSKRFREHWTIRSEQHFRVKQSVDRKLRRLAKEIGDRSSEKGKQGSNFNISTPCPQCGTELHDVATHLGGNLRYCPACSTPLTLAR